MLYRLKNMVSMIVTCTFNLRVMFKSEVAIDIYSYSKDTPP